MKQIVSFTIGNGLDKLARQAYWFEDRKPWAEKLLRNLCMGITNKQMMDILNGDAKVIAVKKGTAVELVYEEDTEFKEELQNHLDFLKEQKEKGRKAKIKAEKHLDYCGDNFSHCKFNSGNRCCFGLRNTYGCFLDNPELMDKRIDSDVKLRIAFILNSKGLRKTGIIPDEVPQLGHYDKDFIEDITIKKVFDFVFNGHHYTIRDSARNQGECPHCGNQPIGDFWNEDDKEAFIGVKKVSDKQFLWCFECPKCFKKFFYHNSRGKND